MAGIPLVILVAPCADYSCLRLRVYRTPLFCWFATLLRPVLVWIRLMVVPYHSHLVAPDWGQGLFAGCVLALSPTDQVLDTLIPAALISSSILALISHLQLLDAKIEAYSRHGHMANDVSRVQSGVRVPLHFRLFSSLLVHPSAPRHSPCPQWLALVLTLAPLNLSRSLDPSLLGPPLPPSCPPLSSLQNTNSLIFPKLPVLCRPQ